MSWTLGEADPVCTLRRPPSHPLKKKKLPSEGGFFFFKGWLLIAPPNARCAREAATRQPTLASSAGFFAVRSQEPPGLGGGGRGRRGRPGGRLGVIAGAARGGLRRCAWRAPALRVAGRSMSLVRAVLGA